jgi:hypothetical protein
MSKKRPQFTSMEKTVAGRRFYAVFGTLAILGGIATIGVGTLYYHNYRGDNVFAPSAIIIGALALLVYFRNRN